MQPTVGCERYRTSVYISGFLANVDNKTHIKAQLHWEPIHRYQFPILHIQHRPSWGTLITIDTEIGDHTHLLLQFPGFRLQ